MKHATRVRVADEVWVVVCLLHIENPDRTDFSIDEIVTHAANVQVSNIVRSSASIRVHVSQHCVSNKRANSCNFRYLFETSRGRRRLFKPDDLCHIERESGQELPAAKDLPEECRYLIDWYRQDYVRIQFMPADPGLLELLELKKLAAAKWMHGSADEYVNSLRTYWL